jgi:hypothetical protein
MQHGLESTPTVKDVHSPAGQPFCAPVSFADLPDCPICRYGTPMMRKDRWICIDCRCDVTAHMPPPLRKLSNDRFNVRSADPTEFLRNLKSN